MRLTRLFRILVSTALFSLLVATAPLAQDNSGGAAKKGETPANGSTVTVTGCLTGGEGRYTLGTMKDELYVLHGDQALLNKFNAQRVQVTGTYSGSKDRESSHDALRDQPPTITVTKIKKLADTCG